MQPAAQAPGPGSSSSPGRERPRFRQDLIAETVDHQGARFIDVMAPEGDNVFRFYEVEYSLACGMDGERDVAGIVKWAQDELGLTPSPQEVRTVIAALGDLGFIESGAAAEAAAASAVAAEIAERAARPTPSPDLEPDIELESSGTERTAPPVPPPDLALGPVGAPRPARATPQPIHAVALPEPGPTSSASDVSIDLSDHIAVRPDDVKEAVRASRVMSAVEAPADAPAEVPADALQVIQDPPTAPASAFDAPTVARIPDPAMLAELTPRPPPQFARSPEPSRPPESSRSSDALKAQPDLPTADTIRVGKTSLRAPAPVKPPVELPSAPVTVKVDKPMPPPVPRSGTSPLLLVVLILVILGAGVFFAWKYVLERPAVDVDTGSPVPVPAPVKPAPPPPPPPPPPTAKIALETPDPEEIKVARQGVIEVIAAENTAVKETEVVAKLKGNKQLEAQVTAMTNDINRQQTLLEAATKRFDTAHAAGNKAAETTAQTEIADRHKLLDAKENARSAKSADYDTFLVHAPKNGAFVPSVKPNAPVAAGAVIGKIVREAIPVATFKLDSTHAGAFAANASVEISVRKGEQRLTCTVADVTADSVKVICPVDPELTDGTEVSLQPPAAATAPPPEPPSPGTAAPGGAPGSAVPGAPAGTPPAGEPPAPAPGGTPAESPPAPSGTAAPAAGSDGKPPG